MSNHHKIRTFLFFLALKIQLVNGSSNNEGRVELIRNGIIGTICDDRWDDADAEVACRMLGYKLVNYIENRIELLRLSTQFFYIRV